MPTLVLDPHRRKTEVPVVLVSGWTNTLKTMYLPAEVLASNGRRVIVLEHDAENRAKKEEMARMPKDVGKQEYQKALALLDMLKREGIAKVDLVGYSEGGLIALMAARINPEKIRNIVTVASAGMSGKTSMPVSLARLTTEALVGFFKAMRDPSLWQPLRMVMRDILGHVLKYPWVSYMELREISQADVLETMICLRQKGIGISVIFGENDKVVLLKEVVRKNLEKGKHMDSLHTVAGGHAEIISCSQKIMELVESELRILSVK